MESFLPLIIIVNIRAPFPGALLKPRLSPGGEEIPPNKVPDIPGELLKGNFGPSKENPSGQ